MKNEIVIVILFSAILGTSIGFVMPAVRFENANIAGPGISEPNIMNYTNFTSLIASRTNVCEECHLSGKKYVPQAYELRDHAKGGAFCLDCHEISHNEHPVNESVSCTSCHGEISPSIPSSGNEDSSCSHCHGYPDALLSSRGNLILIHEPRGINCKDCHIKCERCHQKNILNNGWNKRKDHLDAFIAE